MNSTASGAVDSHRFSPADPKQGLPYSHRPPTPPHAPSLTTSASPPPSSSVLSDGLVNHASESTAAHIPNGHNSPISHHAQDESEAETVVLSESEKHEAKRKSKSVKHESDDRVKQEIGDVSSSQAAGVTQRAQGAESHTPLALSAGISASPQELAPMSNGVDHTAEGSDSRYSDSTSPPTSPSNRAPSHTSASPARQQISPSPTRTTSTRQRSASTTDSRKRKRNDDVPQPPRQKLKTTQPASPDLKAHKRSASSQSTLGPRKSKERHSDSSSDASSPQPQERTSAAQQPRLKRLIYRSATSPARSMPHKKNVDRFGATRLARECEKGDLKAVQGAYDAAPDELDQQDYAGITPLQKAALNGFPDVVKFLLQKGCRTDCQNSDRDTPLIDAVENGHFEVVKILLNVARVNPHHQNKQGQRALDVLREDVDDAEGIEKELRRAMQRESNGADESARDTGASQDASSTNLLYNEYNTETLRIKAAEGNMGAVAELLNSNIKPNMACGAAAARGGHDEILSILLGFGMKADPDPMKHSETPMLAAIGRGHLKVIKLLLEQDNFDPTRRNREGKTYWEVAEERRGPKWQQERDTLKEHYNEYRRQHQRSPKKSRTRHLSPTRSQTNNRENGRKTTASSEPPKGRGRLVSARELQQRELQQHRELKRRRRVVADESESESDDSDVRGPVKPAAKAKSKPSYDAPQDNGLSSPEAPEKRLGRKPGSGERSRKSDTVPRDAPPPEPDAMEDIKQETPEPIKTERLARAERLAEAERLEAEKAAEKAAAEAREAEEAEKTRLAAEQARIAAEKAQRDREERLQALPRALRRALQRGKNRPLHFDGEEMGISANFLPVHRVRFKEIDADSPESHHDEWWILSFQAAGILGLPELDLIEFPDWERHPVTESQRQRFLRGYDLAQLAQDFRFPMEGCAEFDPQAIERVMAETRAQFLKMPLEWVRWDDFEAALRGGGYEHLANLKVTTASYIHVHDPAVVNGDVRKPRSFLDVILGSAAARNESHS